MTQIPAPLFAAALTHQLFQAAASDIAALVAAKDPANGLVIPFFGPTRVGKTWVIEHLQKELGRPGKGHGFAPAEIDFVIEPIPPKPSDRDIYRSILGALGRRWSSSEQTADLRKRVITAVRDSGVQVIALDECSHCAERGANLSARVAADHIKTIVDETGICLILLGLPRFQQIIDANEQLRDRSTNTIFFRPYNWQSASDREGFAGAIAAALDSLEPAGVTVAIAFEDLLPRLYGASAGRVPRALDLIKAALVHPAGSALDLRQFERAARGRQQLPISPAMFFRDEPPDDRALIRSYAVIMAEAGLPFDAETADGLQVTWDMRAAS